jgi:hypothetical protein
MLLAPALLLLTAVTAPAACEPPTVAAYRAYAEGKTEVDPCAYYLCVDEATDGEYSELLVDIAASYCDTFIDDAHPRMSKAGKAFLEDTAICLMRETETLFGGTPATVHELIEGGIEGHIGCYVQSGFCDLSIADRLVIMDTVSVGDLADPQIMMAFARIAGRCWL